MYGVEGKESEGKLKSLIPRGELLLSELSPPLTALFKGNFCGLFRVRLKCY